ncbi:MAG TPA: ABC-2 family transporter protein [Candidatus Saccharimonadales bacterium]|nr:ABC-2 family transporter protein [Candidatus Saccharimonadales bacterium]
MSSLAVAERLPRFAKYFFVSRIGFKDGKVYPLEMLAPSIIVVARLWVFTLVLKAAFASKGVTAVNGFTPAMSMWVLMFAQSFQQASKGRVWLEISRDVQSGAFATLITKPVSYGLFHFSRYLGNIIPALATSLSVGVVSVLVLVGPVHFSLLGALIFLPMFAIGISLNFMIYFCVGLTSLWLEDSTPITWIVSKMILIFGGMIVPIAILPGVTRQIAQVLPFAQLFALPSQLVVSFNVHDFERIMITQLSWLVVAIFFSIWFFKKGRRHVASNGG